MATKLFLVRHGASSGNTPGNLIGHSDHPLTAHGEAQALSVAARLAPLGPMTVYSSDLPRALATAHFIAAGWASVGDQVISDPRLREIHLGELEGRSWDDFTQNQKLTAALEADPFHTPLPGGESLALLQERVIAAVNEIVAAATADAAICLVAHDGPIRAIVNHYLGVSPEKWWVVTTTHGGLSLLEFSDGWVDLRFFNDTAHLAAVDYSP